MAISTQLWTDNADLAAACRQHPFVGDLITGELARARFVAYVEQDAWFLHAFARGYALALAKAPDAATMAQLRTLLDGVFEELELHRGYAERWGARLDPDPSPATLAYTDFLLRVAWSEPLASILAALTPCMRLYAHLGGASRPHAARDGAYRDWVDTYASDEFEQLAATLEALLDEHVVDVATVAGHYRTAMRLELAFFDQIRDEVAG